MMYKYISLFGYVCFFISVSCMLGVPGLSPELLLDAYQELGRRWGGRRADKLMHLLWGVSGAIEGWIRGSSGGAGDGRDSMQLAG